MKKIVLVILIIYPLISLYSQIWNLNWQDNYNWSDNDGGRYIKTDKYGSVISVGNAFDPANYGPGNGFEIVRKYSPTGQVEWEYNTAGNYSNYSMEDYQIEFEYINNNQYYIYIRLPLKIVKLDQSGNVIWEHLYNNTSEGYKDLILLGDKIYVCGWKNDSGFVGRVGLLLKFNKNTGQVEWEYEQRGQGPNGYNYRSNFYYSLCTDGNNIYVLGFPNPYPETTPSYIANVNLVQKVDVNSETIEWSYYYNPYPNVDINNPPQNAYFGNESLNNSKIYYINNILYVAGCVQGVFTNNSESYYYLTKISKDGSLIDNYENTHDINNGYKNHSLLCVKYKCGSFIFSGTSYNENYTYGKSKTLLKIDTSMNLVWEHKSNIINVFGFASYSDFDIDVYGNIFVEDINTNNEWQIKWFNNNGQPLNIYSFPNSLGIISNINVYKDSVLNLNGWINNGNIGSAYMSTVSLNYQTLSTDTICKEEIPIVENPSDSIISNINPPNTIEIEFPNIITPNGDGVNDVFKPINYTINEIKNNVKNYKCKIFNRWGKEVYNTNEVAFWDCTTNSNKYVSEGTYYYIISYSISDSEQKIKKGFISIVK